jgi:hypothetical protein
MAHVAETTHVLRVKNRSGNVHDGKAGLPFLRDLWAHVVALLPRGGKVRFRMDGAFFRGDALRWLQARGAGLLRRHVIDRGARVLDALAEHAVAGVEQHAEADRNPLARELRDRLRLAVLVHGEGLSPQTGDEPAKAAAMSSGRPDRTDTNAILQPVSGPGVVQAAGLLRSCR